METEEELEKGLGNYKIQLEQIECAIASTADGPTLNDLQKLQVDLKQLIELQEESLLNVKKDRLLRQLSGASVLDVTGEKQNDLDCEYASFQAALGDELKTNEDNAPDSSIPEQTSNLSMPSGEEENELLGMKCRVKLKQEWGHTEFHNALILSLDDADGDTEPNIKVLFCNPTMENMLTCPYFLDGKCRYGAEDCRFSHGYSVNLSDLQEFVPPDFSNFKLESRCLARYADDDLWYKAIVVEVHDDHTFKIQFDSFNNVETLMFEDIVPLCEDEYDLNDRLSDSGDSEGDADVPTFLWRPSQTSEVLGEWEKYTKGLGSKLMEKMGYIMGQGLGRNSEGRALPVPIELLPQGKSLDKIMELREKAGNQDLYDYMKKNRRKQKAVQSTNAKQYLDAKEKTDVFDFINKKLKGQKGDVSKLIRGAHHSHKEKRKQISEKDLKTKSDKDINVQLFKTHEELKITEKEIARVKESLKRNDGERKVKSALEAKLTSLTDYKEKLLSSENSLHRHKDRRKSHKKLTIF